MQGLAIRRPISILQNLIESFGLQIKIGQMIKKIYLQEEVEIASLNMGQLFEVLNPKNHSFITSSLIRLTEDKKVDCALTFALDKDEYLKWLIIG